MKLLAKYKNGNYNVQLFSDGTKIRYNDLDHFTPEFAESMDVTITTVCSGVPGYDNGNLCEYCYLCCGPHGKHADLNNPIFETVHAGTEMAINANDLTHPDLEDFLIRMKDKGVFVNITINQKHLTPNIEKLKDWQDRQLVWGIGVSLTNSKDIKLFEAIDQLDNVVIHVIDGCFSKEDIENLSNNNIKLLILGFKHKGRGVDYYNSHKEEVDNNIAFLRDHLYDYRTKYNGFAFDNLALEDLDMQSKIDPKQWALYHMGEEGEFTFFISATDNTYAISSMETENIFPIKDGDTVDSMFKHIRKVAGHDK